MSRDGGGTQTNEPSLRVKMGLEKIQQLGPQIAEFLKAAEPALRAVYPYCHLAKEYAIKLYIALEPYHTEEVAEAILAMTLLFLGGQFAMTIACYQAFRMSGSMIMKKSWNELVDSYRTSMAALQKDSEARQLFDANAENEIGPWEIDSGLRDVALAQTEKEQTRARQKILVIMKCLDPNKFMDACIGLWTGIVAILATLRSRFLHAVSIGASAGEQVARSILPVVAPRLYTAFPQHTQWVDFGLRSLAAFIGIMTSIFLIRIISAFNSAIQGARLLVTTLIEVGKRKSLFDAKSAIAEDQMRLAVGVLASMGFVMQLGSGFSLPWILKLPLLPLYILESILMLVAAY